MDYLDFWREVEKDLELEHRQQVFYRVYYDDHGQVLFYSMENLPGNYLEIDRETYARNDSRVRVINGELIPVKSPVSSKLAPAESGQACHPNNVIVVTDSEPQQKWNIKYYD